MGAPFSFQIVSCAAAVLLAACAPAATGHTGKLRVLAAETFLADIAQNVASDRLTVESLLGPGIDPHEFQATPRDAIRIAQAQVLIVNGRGYETWLQKTLAATENQPLVVEASTGVGGDQNDPHLWMSPGNVVRYVENIRDGLSRADPDGASEYAANAEAYIAKLRDLDAWIVQQVAQLPEDRRILVTNHHALESFAKAYSFQIAGVVIPGYTSESAPSAQQMVELLRTIRTMQVPAIFLDVSENPDLARQLAPESGARVITGLYVETLSGSDGPAPSYVEMLKYDVNLIVDALK